MSDQGEKTCPLCAEEMDLTDQQLKPCKCGYELCVWCWHHIMEMAEKVDTEGRCPACRAPYDKEKIVGMAASCERLVAEVNMEKRSKSQKAKTKSSEGRKHLSSVRVIQRNLVYIVGLPLHLANEDLLLRRDYFGQYGKVLKVSMSRTSAGVIQQFPNNTCSVYITYSKEEEAIRCIQSVHGFVLEGRPLRVCFGTTKYCHAWLRNVPCTNPDCLYLHEVGSQEDSFTKDEIISAYTRSRVQQITGNASTLQRRSGNVLPPPVDDFCTNSSGSTGKPIMKTAPITTASVLKGSPPNGSNARPIALPAAASWGTRASSFQSSVPISVSLGGPMLKSEPVERTHGSSAALESTDQAPVSHSYSIKKTSLVEGIQSISAKSLTDPMNTLKQLTDLPPSNSYVASDGALCGSALSSRLSCLSPSKDDNGSTNALPRVKSSLDNARVSLTLDPQTGGNIGNGDIPVLCADISSMKITNHFEHESSRVVGPKSPDPLQTGSPRNQGSEEELYLEEFGEKGGNKTVPPNLWLDVSSDQCPQNLVLQNQVPSALAEVVEDDIRTFDNQRLRDPEVGQHSFCSSSPNHSRSHSYIPSEVFGMRSSNADPVPVNNTLNGHHSLLASCSSTMSNGYHDSFASETADSNGVAASFIVYPKEVTGRQMVDNSAIAGAGASSDTGESSIISNILSLDSDAWDDSLTSPHYLAKLLGETDEQPGSMKTLTSRKVSNSNQSRFSFARQEESQAFDFEPPHGVPGQLSGNGLLHKDGENRESFSNRIGMSNGFHPQSLVDADNFSGSQSLMASGKSSVSRSQMLAPPGFSAPSKAPPPGFSSRERMDHSFDSLSRNQLLDTTSWLSNLHQPPSAGNIGNTVDIEFMDPAILAVGKGRHQNGLNNLSYDVKPFPQSNAFEGDSRLHSLMQGSLSPHQNLAYVAGDNYSNLNGTYGLPSRILDRSQVGGTPPFSPSTLQQARNGLSTNVHWDGWNEIQSGDSLGISQLLRNERVGLKKFYDGYEDSKLWMSGSGDLYNRNFGM
ncbi:uncharacterized protein LOC115736626 isoform X2 [Rhodamnia argentea]|uniref:Uncharacterized protein LOC115736626 isoform X2 n=1 Tax=Rhodamnia argentea TaxID=178133 RepID=A0A8B8NQP5_9MYRT|nr:uncharacterized protein LOC115736626 isoform X2 [Rhodamnia argentea]